MKNDFAATKNMFSAYLNQDFDLMFGDADGAIRTFVEHSTQSEVLTVMDELRAILAMKLPEKEVQDLIFQDLGSFYYYPTEWSSAEPWLEHVLKLLDAVE